MPKVYLLAYILDKYKKDFFFKQVSRFTNYEPAYFYVIYFKQELDPFFTFPNAMLSNCFYKVFGRTVYDNTSIGHFFSQQIGNTQPDRPVILNFKILINTLSKE